VNKHRVEKRNLWRHWNWKEISLEFTLFGVTWYGLLVGKQWFIITFLNFQYDREWYKIYFDEDGAAWPFPFPLEDEGEKLDD